MIKKGFSLLEILLTLVIVSSMLVLTLPFYSDLDLKHLYFLNDYLLKQKDSLISHERNDVDYGITFNENGRVNQAKTIDINSHKLIVHLGNGYITYE